MQIALLTNRLLQHHLLSLWSRYTSPRDVAEGVDLAGDVLWGMESLGEGATGGLLRSESW